MAIRSTEIRVKQEGSGGVAFYIKKSQTGDLSVKPGDSFSMVYDDSDPDAPIIITKSIDFNPRELFEMMKEDQPMKIPNRTGSPKTTRSKKRTPRGGLVPNVGDELVLRDTGNDWLVSRRGKV